MLIINHVRDHYTADSTFGKLYANNMFVCHTLEDTVRQPSIKVAGHTAIPEGVYAVDITHSSKFGRDMVILFNSSGLSIKKDGITFTGIRVHGGNDDEDTAGCVLVAKIRMERENRISGTEEKKVYDIVKHGLSDVVLWVVSSEVYHE